MPQSPLITRPFHLSLVSLGNSIGPAEGRKQRVTETDRETDTEKNRIDDISYAEHDVTDGTSEANIPWNRMESLASIDLTGLFLSCPSLWVLYHPLYGPWCMGDGMIGVC